MSEEHPVEETQTQDSAVETASVDDNNEDSVVDAVSAVALVLIAVCIALYWVAGQ